MHEIEDRKLPSKKGCSLRPCFPRCRPPGNVKGRKPSRRLSIAPHAGTETSPVSKIFWNARVMKDRKCWSWRDTTTSSQVTLAPNYIDDQQCVRKRLAQLDGDDWWMARSVSSPCLQLRCRDCLPAPARLLIAGGFRQPAYTAILGKRIQTALPSHSPRH